MQEPTYELNITQLWEIIILLNNTVAATLLIVAYAFNGHYILLPC